MKFVIILLSLSGLFASPLKAQTPADVLVINDPLAVAVALYKEGDKLSARYVLHQFLLSKGAGDSNDYKPLLDLFVRIHQEEESLDEALSLLEGLRRETLDNSALNITLAQVYHFYGEVTIAASYLEKVPTFMLPENKRAEYDDFERYLTSKLGFSMNINLALEPSSNINSATTAREVDLFGLPFQLDESARKKSGTGVTGVVSGRYENYLNHRYSYALQAGGKYTLYPTLNDYNNGLFFVEGGIKRHFGARSLSLAPVGYMQTFSGKKYLMAKGGKVTFEVKPASNKMLSITTGMLGLNNYFDDNKDGHRVFAELGGKIIPKSDPTLLINLGARISAETAKGKALSYHQANLTASIWKKINSDFSVSFSQSFGYSRYRGVLPAFGQRSKGLFSYSEFGLTLDELAMNQIMPRVYASYRINQSSIDLYDFSSFSVGLAFVKRL